MARRRVAAGLLDPVVRRFKPRQIILFGSAARGDAGRDRDVDLLVIVDHDTPADKLGVRRETPPHTRPADVFAMRAERFERERAIAGTIAAEADADGVVVYGPPKGAPPIKIPDTQARWEVVERWFDAAGIDRKAAAASLNVDPHLRPSVAFHCQQAAEKLLKGFLVLAAKRVRKPHSLRQLGDMAVASFPELAELAGAVSAWSEWGVVYRYASDNASRPLPDEAGLRDAFFTIDQLVAELRSHAPTTAGEPT